MRTLMHTIEELERSWAALLPLPQKQGRVEMIVVRPAKGMRDTPAHVEISPALGVHGDRWSKGSAPEVDRQITLMNARVAEIVAGPRTEGTPWELFGDNFLVDIDLGEDTLPAGTILALGSALIQVTAVPHTGCKNYRQRFGSQALRWVNHKKYRSRRLRGVNGRILQAGTVAVGDAISVQ